MMEIPITNRPFWKDSATDKYLAVQSAETTLGITLDELERIKSNGGKILEIGPGGMSATLDLYKKGFDVTVVEPALMPDNPNSNRLQRILARYASNVIALPCFAQQLIGYPHLSSAFELAFALGPNFQNYANNGLQLVEGIKGILHTLKPQGSLVFEIDKGYPVSDTAITIFLSQQKSQTVRFYKIEEFLDNNGVPFEIEIDETKGTHAIRIFKTQESFRKLSMIEDSQILAYVCEYSG